MYNLNYIPMRGDVVMIDFNPQKGKEIFKRRPALVLSSRDFNSQKRLALFCPITSKGGGSPFEVHIPEGLKVDGVILTDQTKSLDWSARKAGFKCQMPDNVVITVSQIVEAIVWGEN